MTFVIKITSLVNIIVNHIKSKYLKKGGYTNYVVNFKS